MKDHSGMVESENKPIEYLKFAAVLVFISVVAYLLAGTHDWQQLMRWFMGVFFVVFASFKFAGYQMFVMMFQGYDVIAKRFRAYAYAYPFVEAALGLAFIIDASPGVRNLLTLSIMSIGAIGVFQEIYHRRSGIHCACLGNIIKLPLSTVSLVEDVAMASMALVMLIS